MRIHDKMVRRNIYLPDVLYKKYTAEALKMGVGAAELIRTALAQYLKDVGNK